MLAYDAGSTYEKPDPRLITQWKRKQSPREVGLVEAKIGMLLQDAGYAPSGHPQVKLGALERAGLWLQNKHAVWSWRFRRYGLLDPLLVRIASSIGFPSIARAARRRMDDVQVRYLK
jgi:hypothetical protein